MSPKKFEKKRCRDIIPHMRHDRLTKTLQSVVTFLLIPSLNITAFIMTDALRSNLSQLSMHAPWFLFLWGSCSALNFLYMSRLCYGHCHYTQKKTRSLWLSVSCLCMVLCLLIPYDPVQENILNQWHVRLGFIGTACYVLQFFHFLLTSINEGWLFLRPFLYAYVLLCFISLYSTALSGGVTGMSEVIFSCGMSLYLYLLVRRCDTFKNRKDRF